MPRPNGPNNTLIFLKEVCRRIGYVPIFLIGIWIVIVLRGEHRTFDSHINECLWHKWEDWQGVPNPHHVLLVADPQLVDPHTYPDRPWPLSTLTILYTDLYLKRAYKRLLSHLQPHSTIFLGDLFDGGREWSARKYTSPEERYRQYGQDFWLQEYQRFQDLFVKTWHEAGISSLPSDDGRRLITSLPGNHDLGFAGGINAAVQSRFEAHFGPSNRIDVLGNHTFVALDTVSLSAMDQVDPETGASGMGDGSAAATASSKIWKPVEAYLSQAKSTRERAIRHEIQRLRERQTLNKSGSTQSKHSDKFQQTVEDAREPQPTDMQKDLDSVATSQFPTIVLSHVPLYRSDADSGACGPLRERGTHIPLSQGYQYQNVLTPLISKDIIDHLDASQVTQIYSGDDHDYCEIEHDEFTGRIREITVKSMSWAMGIRKPGVQLASLWNPIDLDSAMVSSQANGEGETKMPKNMPKHTIQNHMCLLPDQLGIFIGYAELLIFTFIVLITRALRWRPTSTSTSTTLSKSDLETENSLPMYSYPHTNGNTKDDMSPLAQQSSLPYLHTQTQSITSRRGNSNSNGSGSANNNSYGNIPLSSRSRSRSTSPSKSKFSATADSDDWGNPTTPSDRMAYSTPYQHQNQNHSSNLNSSWIRSAPIRILSRLWIFRASRSKVSEFVHSVFFVGGPVLTFYGWLLWRDL